MEVRFRWFLTLPYTRSWRNLRTNWVKSRSQNLEIRRIVEKSCMTVTDSIRSKGFRGPPDYVFRTVCKSQWGSSVTPDSCGVQAFHFNQSYSPNLMKLMSFLGGKTKVSERVWPHNGTPRPQNPQLWMMSPLPGVPRDGELIPMFILCYVDCSTNSLRVQSR